MSATFAQGKLEGLFWAKVRKTEGCWLWMASKNQKDYGRIGWHENKENRHMLTNRFSWQLAHGPVPDGLCVLHRCDVPACVNPEHLFLGTKGDNNRDRAAKGRSRRDVPRNAILTEAQVIQIRAWRQVGTTIGQLAKRYGVGKTCIRLVIHRVTWRHLP